MNGNKWYVDDSFKTIAAKPDDSFAEYGNKKCDATIQI